MRDFILGIRLLRDKWNLGTKRTHLDNGIGLSLLVELRPMREHATMHGDAYSIFLLK